MINLAQISILLGCCHVLNPERWINEDNLWHCCPSPGIHLLPPCFSLILLELYMRKMQIIFSIRFTQI